MALQRIERDGIQDDAINAAKIEDGTVAGVDIVDGTITNTQIHASAAIATSKISGLGTAAALAVGTAANNVVQLDGSARLPAVSGANLTGVATDTSAMENNIAILAFKTQSANDLVKFNLIDQVVDEFEDNSGIDAIASTNETLTSGYYKSSAAGGTSTSWEHVFTGSATNSDGWATWNYRFKLTSAMMTHTGTAGQVRVTVTASTAAPFHCNHVYIAPWTSGAKGYAAASTPTSFLYSSGAAFNVPANNVYVSDWLTFDVNTASDYIVGWDLKDTGGANDGLRAEANGAVLGAYNTRAGGSGGWAYNVNDWTSGTHNAKNDIMGINKIEVIGSDVYNPLTLQSNATTAESAPTTGDIVMLITDNGGTPADVGQAPTFINTDIKAYISRNGNFSTLNTDHKQATLVDKGNWGTNKRILVANNVDLSGITTGTSMKYKIETLNQTSSKYTYIDAVSLAWA